MPETEKTRIYEFGEFQMNVAEEILRRNGEKVSINRRTFQVLRLLLERAAEIVSKQNFFDVVWAETFVEDNVLTVTMTTLRKALDDDAKSPKYIENLPRKGYRFIAEVKVIDDAAPVVQSGEKTEIAPTSTGKFFKQRRVIAAISAACLLFLTTAIGFYYFKSAPSAVSPANAGRIESIAVLPFENQDPETEYLSDGLTDGVINDLTVLPNLRVISRNSVFQHKNKGTDLTTIGRDLNAQAILTGRFVQRGDDLFISAELTDARDNRQIWGRQYNYKTPDALDLQQEISRDVSRILRPHPSALEENQLTNRQTDNSEAYKLYLKGRYYWNKRTQEDFAKAVDFFKQAIDKDPTYARAYIGLANSYALQTSRDLSEDERSALVRDAAQKALEIDDRLGEAYAVLAINDCFHEWKWADAEREYRRAIELNPSYATAHHWFAEFLALEGRFEESFAEYKRAIELDPHSLAVKTDLGFAYFYARQNDRAIEYLQNLKKIDAKYPRTYSFLMAVYQEKGMFEEAIDELAAFYTVQGNDSSIYVKNKESLKNAVRMQGAKGYWRKMLELDLESRTSGPFGLAMTYARLGEKEKAFEHLEKAYLERNAAMAYLKARPEFNNLRADPRFIDLIRRVGMP
jgi:DNA-binding winged helix-turn-helix (wHTH) protein/TolB-like protein/Flp pilus assembly protein TadD